MCKELDHLTQIMDFFFEHISTLETYECIERIIVLIHHYDNGMMIPLFDMIERNKNGWFCGVDRIRSRIGKSTFSLVLVVIPTVEDISYFGPESDNEASNFRLKSQMDAFQKNCIQLKGVQCFRRHFNFF